MELSPQQDVYYIDTVSPIDYFIDTVTPSAIQLNKEKTMSIELDGPLYLGSNSLQQQVDQNTEDITELQSDVSSIEGDIGSLDNLATSDKSSLVNAINETLSVLDPTQTADYIKNSKGLESGEISDNASIYPWVEEMSHSTFDRSKFNVVGSSKITDDGVASGFGRNDFIKISAVSQIGSEYKIDVACKITDNLPSSNQWIAIVPLSLGSTSPAFGIGIGGSDKKFISILRNQATGSNEFILSNVTPLTNNSYRLTAISDLNTYIRFYINGVLVAQQSFVGSGQTLNSERDIFIGGFPSEIGTYVSLPFTSGSIDLKQFSITVDGVEVFSGNKTGIDTIKPDNYTVVGTPTISADGIASGFSVGNCIRYTSPNLGQATSWSIHAKFKTGESLGNESSNIFASTPTNQHLAMVITYINNKFYIGGAIGNAQGDNWQIVETTFHGITQILPNTEYYAILDFTGTSYNVYLSTDDITYNKEATFNSSEKIYNSSDLVSSIGTSRANISNHFLGSIDLNALKIYVDGNLVYQPCLKVPYTESKTGAKVVDSIYRDRVKDMYEQFGYAPYYTLDTTNSNYTIPKGEVYGMVNKLVPTLVAPDYSKPVSLTYSSGLVMENDGWLEVQIQSSEATANPYVSINGSIICRTSVNSNGDLNRDTAMMVVRKGDIITSGGYSADTAIVLTYYPFKV